VAKKEVARSARADDHRFAMNFEAEKCDNTNSQTGGVRYERVPLAKERGAA
jgi:hypothetical protein